MTTEAFTLCESFKSFYHDALMKHGIKQQAEAFGLGVDQSTVSNYRNPDAQPNLPFALAAKSKVADELAAWLSQMVGGVHVKLCGTLDGHSCDEQCAVLKAMAKLQVEQDPNKRAKLWRIIEQNAAKGFREDSK
jgi:predicted transcriptional regulator